jgi:GTP cyclohydrolase IIa
MIQLTIIRIEGYGPWTVTLGSDREAQLQMLQAKIYHDVQDFFHGRNCIVYFNRFDEYFAITNGLDASGHREIRNQLASAYPDLKMSMAVDREILHLRPTKRPTPPERKRNRSTASQGFLAACMLQMSPK